MAPSLARWLAAAAACGAAQALAQAPSSAASNPTATVPLPPQNYGAQPGFFRSAPEMAAFEAAEAGIVRTPPAAAPAPATPVTAPAAIAAAVAAPAPASAVANPQRVPDPTQNLQWAEGQMDRAEATAIQQKQTGTTPAPVAPGAYNGATDPNDR
ncbi:MAG TPA: hypothetical protein VFE23_17160 [Usitatibacter sp.]|jgi:hypothetical protein|nr:hypothetical protein [Usitatibacter sp.]